MTRSYDEVNRLKVMVEQSTSDAAVVFTKNAFTPAPGQFNALNQTTVNSAAYDAAGNQSGIGGFSRTHDAENRIVQSILNGITTTFAYDGDGRRVRKGSTVYVYDATGNWRPNMVQHRRWSGRSI